jgi:hypothetical protein
MDVATLLFTFKHKLFLSNLFKKPTIVNHTKENVYHMVLLGVDAPILISAAEIQHLPQFHPLWNMLLLVSFSLPYKET